MIKGRIQLFVLFLIVIFIINNLYAQNDEPRKSPKAKVSQTIGLDTEITIEFSRPGVKGRKIWGELVPWGMAPGSDYSNNKPYPWRGGANENTTIEFNKDLIIEGNKVPAGKYSLHFAPQEDKWTVMLNSVNDSWGSYQYDPSKDVLKFEVTPLKAPHQEWLVYGFDDYDGYSATAYLRWEKLKVPFKIEVAK